ncbi:hypothetical protein ACHQM5_010697 [Ranunculus cassubicifolius]
MASALLASRAEPLWGERKVYARKNPNPNPNSKSSLNLNPNSNSFKQLNHHGRQMESMFLRLCLMILQLSIETPLGSNRRRP